MKIIGGPRNGQIITIAEKQGGPELIVPGMVLEYTFTEPGKVNIKMTAELEPKPSVPGLAERYKCQDGAWHYIAPSSALEFTASPAVVME
jgi:hypothetical protein